ncbi:PREDICTED: uncharacterized protein LOC108637096 [Capra hircus]|uniref:uncharacterized protein LOC108637096 n=1 Tax=Capra hircus TaxID=9925 RepID=UPI000846CA12|nr:PREDICTED: uncharacterized protein LOC108637096 [Capra hircus]
MAVTGAPCGVALRKALQEEKDTPVLSVPTDNRPCADGDRRRPPPSHKELSRQNPPPVDGTLILELWPPKLRKSLLLKPPGRCGLLWTPKLTETPPLRASPAPEGWVDALCSLFGLGLLGSVWIFRLGNHRSGFGGVSAQTLFWTCSASVFEAQTTMGYRLRIFQQQVDTLIRVAALREVDTDHICALGGRAFSKFNYNLSVKHAPSVGVSCLAHNYLPALSQSPSYDASVCCERLIYRLLIG